MFSHFKKSVMLTNGIMLAISEHDILKPLGV